MKRRYLYKEVRELIECFGYELIDQEYFNTILPLIIKDKEGFYYKIPFNNIRKGNSLAKFHKNNPYTIQNIKLWIKLNSKPFKLISDEYRDANKKLKWKCLKDNEIFEKGWSSILTGIGCPYCAGLQVGISNCLATKIPSLINQWHLTLNENTTPYNVTPGSSKEVWWQCDKNSKHIWKTTVRNRVSNQSGCPYCSGFYPSEDYNLLIINPKLCEEWDYERNDKKPEEYTPSSSKYAWWICKECGYKWNALISSRTSSISCACPECSKSKGEKAISKYLKENYIIFDIQKIFDSLIGLGSGNLSYDFYLSNYNLLIEYQGEFHDHAIKNYKNEPLKFAEERLLKQQEHDRRKREYAKQNNINLLEIWYFDFDNIEEILNKELNNYMQCVGL